MDRYLLQGSKRVFRRLAVEQNLILGRFSRKPSRAKLRREAERVDELFPVLGQKRGPQPGACPAGSSRCWPSGQALMAEPTVLPIDEPSSGSANR
jgi:branched-chain amino acid transport system ATP-binding protein